MSVSLPPRLGIGAESPPVADVASDDVVVFELTIVVEVALPSPPLVVTVTVVPLPFDDVDTNVVAEMFVVFVGPIVVAIVVVVVAHGAPMLAPNT